MSAERIKTLKERAMTLAEQGLNQDVSCMNAKEVGEVVDMVKDLSEACYYANIVEAMEKTDQEEKYMEKYLPEMAYARSYTPYYRSYPMTGYIDPTRDNQMYYTVGRGGRPRTNYGDMGGSNMNGSRMNYGRTNYDRVDNGHDEYDGESWQYRRSYMESKNSGQDSQSMKDLEQYAKTLMDDILDMIEDATPQEKTMLKQKISTLATKIN